MSKLTWHFQSLPQDIAQICANSGARYVKIVDPPTDDPFPGKRTIGRTWARDEQDIIGCGSQGAVEWFNRWQATYTARPWVYAWEGPNEPATYNTGMLASVNEFYTCYTALMHQHNLKVVGLVFAEGHPPPGRAAEVKDALAVLDYASLHEYGCPNVLDGAPWHILRYRDTVAEWRAASCRVPPMFISECGITGGVLGRADEGWQKYATTDQFWQGLCAYDDELTKDDYVEAAFIFTSGPEATWQTFDFNAELSRRLVARIGEVPPPPPPPPPIKQFNIIPYLPWDRTVEQFEHRPVAEINKTIVHYTYVKTPLPTYEAELENIRLIALSFINNKRWPGVPYHILIGPSGNVYWANPSDVNCWHAKDANWNSRGIALLKMAEPPTAAAIASLKYMIAAFGLPAYPHRHFVQTACPGVEVMRAMGWE